MMLLTIISICLLALAQKCTLYSCSINNTGVLDTDFVCMQKSYNNTTGIITYLLSTDPCRNKGLCQYSFSDSPDLCVPYLNYSLAPGENCTYPGSCYSGICTNGVCVGSPNGDECAYDIECDIGMACNAGECSSVVAAGSACDFVNSKCDPRLVCNMGICVAQGSLDIGKAADNALACKSMYIAPQTATTTDTVCTAGPKLENKEVTNTVLSPCPNDSICRYTTSLSDKSVYVEAGQCQCGRGPTQNLYCPLGKGDLANDVLVYFNFTAHQAKACHISKGVFCDSLYWGNMTLIAYSAWMNLSEPILFDSKEQCMRKINEKYYNGVSAYIYNESSHKNDDNGSNDSAMFGINKFSGSYLITMAILIISLTL